LNHPLFNSDRFEKATDSGFFISIEAGDPIFDVEKTARFLESIGGKNPEVVKDE
jgi:hypothetical protein